MSSILATVLARRGRHRWTSPLRHAAVSGALVVAACAVLFASCSPATSPAPAPSSTPTGLTFTVYPVPSGTGPGAHVVTYQAAAPGKVTVVYPSLGTVATVTAAASPWSHQASVPDDDLGLVTLAAGDPQGLAGAVSCSILVDGRVAVHHARTGPYASVLCSLAVPGGAS